MNARTILTLAAIMLASCLSNGDRAPAAVITATQDLTPTESEVQTGAGNTDILAAVNLGENQGTGPGRAMPVTVNGVNFQTLSAALPGTGTSTAISETFGTSAGQVEFATTARGFSTFPASDFDANGTSDLPSPLDALYDPIVVGNDSGSGVDIEFNFSNLQIGERYTFQVFMASSDQTNRIVDFLQGGTSLLATYDNTAPHAEIITFAWGADQTTEQIILRGNELGSGVPIISGFSFSTAPVPEPSTGMMAIVSAVALPLLRSRRRKARDRAGRGH